MKIVIEIPEERFNDIKRIAQVISYRRLPALEQVIANGTPLPKGHGRLIDESDLMPDSDYEDGIFYAVSIGAINGAPTIIEADKESAEWVDDKCSVCGKGIEDLIESSEWYQNENPKYCPFCGIKIQPYKDRKRE